MLALAITTAVLSAFLDNVTTILLIVPITFLLADALDIDPVPLLIIEIVASNIGGTATLIGDPPNILIAGHTGLSFGAFIANLAPIVVVTLAVVIPRAVLRVPLAAADRARGARAGHGARRGASRSRTRRGAPHRADPGADDPRVLRPQAAAPGAGHRRAGGRRVMLLVTRQSLHGTISSIEWLTLFFLIGLFVMVGALEETGALEEVADGIAAVTGGDRTAELLGILWVSAIGSGLVDNIPFTAAMIPVVDSLGRSDDAYWWALALGACFGGNATIVAAACNVAASGMAARAGTRSASCASCATASPSPSSRSCCATAYVMLRYA